MFISSFKDFGYFKFYYRILRQRRRSIQKKDPNGIMDIDNVNNFFKNNKHLQLRFSNVPLYSWGI